MGKRGFFSDFNDIKTLDGNIFPDKSAFVDFKTQLFLLLIYRQCIHAYELWLTQQNDLQ